MLLFLLFEETDMSERESAEDYKRRWEEALKEVERLKSIILVHEKGEDAEEPEKS